MSHTPPRTRIVLVDDQPLFRKALASLINGQMDLQVVAEGESGAEALGLLRTHQPDLLVMDVQMPGMGGADGVRTIRAAGVATPIVMLTISDDDEDLFDCIRAGANGYLLKNMRPDALFDDLRLAARGEAPIAPSMAGRLLEWFRTGGGPAAPAESAPGMDPVLTRREAEILQLVAAGLSNKEIATRLVITEGTVKNHVHNSLEKLHLTNRVQAAAYAVRQGGVPRTPDGTGDRPGDTARPCASSIARPMDGPPPRLHDAACGTTRCRPSETERDRQPYPSPGALPPSPHGRGPGPDAQR